MTSRALNSSRVNSGKQFLAERFVIVENKVSLVYWPFVILSKRPGNGLSEIITILIKRDMVFGVVSYKFADTWKHWSTIKWYLLRWQNIPDIIHSTIKIQYFYNMNEQGLALGNGKYENTSQPGRPESKGYHTYYATMQI